jgi:gamma-glutamyl hercynylcysteine S-oxide synthase
LPLPDADGTREYLAATLAQTLRALDELPVHASDDDLYFFRLVALHEMMHAEAASYMAQHLGIELGAGAPPRWPCEPAAELELPAQRWRLGSEATGFAFDNELAAHEVEIRTIAIDDRPMSWARFLPFVEAGGYEQPSWWPAEAGEWLAGQAERRPRALRRVRGEWEQRDGERWEPLDPAQPAVHLTAFEAQAWCRWAGRRLPSEAEWECAALTLPGFVWGHGWEWTASVFAPFAGFTPHPYRDYSQPWFHTRRVLRGACPATSPSLAHARYRNFFEPHRSDVFAGFRSCRDLGAVAH